MQTAHAGCQGLGHRVRGRSSCLIIHQLPFFQVSHLPPRVFGRVCRDYAELQKLEAQAQSAGRGVWASQTAPNAVRQVLYQGQYSASQVFAKLQGKTVNGTLEGTVSATALVVVVVTTLPLVGGLFV